MFFIDTTVTSKTRFDRRKLVNFTTNVGYDILDSYFVNQLVDLPIAGQYQVFGDESRPDLISYNIYGHVQYWWILMIYNEVWDELEITAGTKWNYPSLADLEDLFFSLRALGS
jgi:hypothetical protein